MPAAYQTFADLVLLLHASIVVFVVAGLVMVLVGNFAGWPWVNYHWFRWLHLTAIMVVVLESWVGITCPLTTLESWLRAEAGSASYTAGFIEHWVKRFLFYQAPTWVFTFLYSVFGLLVAGTWWCFPPVRAIKSPRPTRQAQ